MAMREPTFDTAFALAAKTLVLCLAPHAQIVQRLTGCGARTLLRAWACCIVFGFAATYAWIHVYLLTESELGHFPIIEGNSSAAPRVAIIGAGPSGMGALWALKLHAPERDVTIFEMTASVGGHGTTVHDRGKP